MSVRAWFLPGMVVLAALGLAVTAWAEDAPAGPDPVVQRWTSWPHPVTCSGLEFDPVVVFSGTTRAEKEAGGPQRALRRFLREPGWGWIPKHHWRLVARNRNLAEFVQGRVSSHIEREMSALSFRRAKGIWKWAGSGGCIPRTVRNHFPAAEWMLDEESPAPQASAEGITVRVEERSCSSGEQPYSRLQVPEIRYTDTAAFITFWVTPRRGIQTCEGILPEPYELKLPAPLGNRRLFDAGTYPPRLIEPSSG